MVLAKITLLAHQKVGIVGIVKSEEEMIKGILGTCDDLSRDSLRLALDSVNHKKNSRNGVALRLIDVYEWLKYIGKEDLWNRLEYVADEIGKARYCNPDDRRDLFFCYLERKSLEEKYPKVVKSVLHQIDRSYRSEESIEDIEQRKFFSISRSETTRQLDNREEE